MGKFIGRNYYFSKEEQMSLNLKVMKQSGFINLTQRAEGNAGFDLYATEEGSIAPGQREAVPVGISTSFSPEYYMRVAPRSGLAVKSGVNVLAGVIDSSYRGEWKVVLHNTSQVYYHYEIGDRIAQAIPEKISTEEFEFVDSLLATERGAGGFGSTGR
jgi:dUTP pyrophosphatase